MATFDPTAPVDTSSFTPDQLKAYNYAASLATTPPKTISASTLSTPVQPLQVSSASPYIPPAAAPVDYGVAAAQAERDQTKSALTAAYDQQGQITARTQQLEGQAGLPQMNAELQDLNALDQGFVSDLNNIAAQTLQSNIKSEDRQAPMFAITGEQAQAQRQAAFLQQNVNIKRSVNNARIALAQGHIQNAQANIQRALDLEFKPIEARINMLTSFLTNNENRLTAAQQAQLQGKITEQTRAYEEQKAAQEKVYDILKSAQQAGADPLTLHNIQNSKTPEEALAAAGSFIAPNTYKQATDAQGNLVEYQLSPQGQVISSRILSARPTGSGDAPTVKTINGVDMQWNPKTQTWENIGGSTNTDQTQKTRDQLSFLRTAVSDATKLAGAAGPSAITRILGDTFVGDSKFRQLEAQTNTLRTNVLTLMTDPTVKKFFGPQMSNADVALMTAAGTTLNPQNNTPEQIKSELQRLDSLFLRMQNAVSAGTKAEANGGFVIQSPDGPVQIID